MSDHPPPAAVSSSNGGMRFVLQDENSAGIILATGRVEPESDNSLLQHARLEVANSPSLNRHRREGSKYAYAQKVGILPLSKGRCLRAKPMPTRSDITKCLRATTPAP